MNRDHRRRIGAHVQRYADCERIGPKLSAERVIERYLTALGASVEWVTVVRIDLLAWYGNHVARARVGINEGRIIEIGVEGVACVVRVKLWDPLPRAWSLAARLAWALDQRAEHARGFSYDRAGVFSR